MRRTVLALLAVTVMVAGCQPPAEAPATAPAEATAAPPEMPVDAPPQEEVDPAVAGSCLAEIGAEAAARLVERCVMVSPATHPPCNTANPCAMIQGEIDRSCAMYGPGETKPSQCGA